MNSTPTHRRPRFIGILAVASLAFTLLTGCTQREQEKVSETIKESYEDTKEALTRAWNEVRDYSFERRDDFNASAKALAARMEAQVSEVRANFSEAEASASRKAAMKELEDSKADFNARMDALGEATADTWDSAKQNVILAWDRLQASYHKARADD